MLQIKFLCDSVLKQQPLQSSQLSGDQKCDIKAGCTYDVQVYTPMLDHVKVTFVNQTFQGKNTWYVFQKHAVVVKEKKVVCPSEIKLKVPYKSQLDNTENPYGTCNVTSIAMALSYLGLKGKNPKKQLEDEFQDWMEAKGLDRHSPQDLAKLVEGYGYKDTFKTNATVEEVQDWLIQGNPAVIHGYFTTSGHIVCVIGFNQKGFIVNDPFGEWHSDGYDTYSSGAGLTYSYGMIDKTCRHDGDFWVHFISKK